MASARFLLVSYQPFRLLFRLLYCGVIALQLPYFVLRAAVPSLRPHATWSAKQTFMMRLAYRILDLLPSASSFYKGLLTSTTTKPATIGGTWYPRAPGEDIASKPVFLYFHGGAFIQGDGRDANCGLIAKKLLDKGSADAIFSVQYRLSGYGGLNPFPAALQDALSSYLFLLNDLHVPASQIVVAGDSAGGNLTIALLLYLHNFGAATGVSTPKCAVLLSPWVAPFHYHMDDNPHRGTDFVPASYSSWGADNYAGSWPNARSDPYITQLGNPFPTPVPIFANAGSAEMFYERILQWADEMRGVEGNVVEVHHEEAAPHDTFLSAELLGFEKSAWEVAAKIGEFVAKHSVHDSCNYQ
ncbi:alpha/beta hydrolase fold-3 domain-containing protein [Xylaria palmicola]|nr:alpha/beta hydrolase fold-3 domain-containing protein [Xylaria palmicola]